MAAGGNHGINARPDMPHSHRVQEENLLIFKLLGCWTTSLLVRLLLKEHFNLQLKSQGVRNGNR